MSGNVPPRQPKWESQAASKRMFTSNEGGGPTKNSGGEVYARIGGGLKRFRVAKAVKGYWKNTFMKGDEASWINSTAYDTIGKRPELFESLLGEANPTDKRKALLQVIEDARAHLRKYPASCAARIRRERAFDDLYELNMTSFGMGHADTDEKYRHREDFIFAELVYEKSPTCCWNSSNSKMFEIILDYITTQEEAADSCTVRPTVFKMVDGGFAAFAAHAKKLGLENAWRSWSADESCPQKGATADVEAVHDWAPYCGLDLFQADTRPDTD